MSESNQDADRSEKATPFKLEQARRQGQVAKSPDFVSLVVMSVVLVSLFGMGAWAIGRYLEILSDALVAGPQLVFNEGSIMALGTWLAGSILGVMAPFIILIAFSAIVANLLVSGPVFSFKPLAPQFSRLNPANGLKRIFSIRTVYETGKTILKISLIMAVTYFVVIALLPEIAEIPGMEVRQWPEFILGLIGVQLFSLIGALAIVVAADLTFSRWEFQRQMRMSRRELREELRRREGDPQIKSKRRQLIAELKKRSESMGKVKDASLVIVNPQHLAVALRYERGKMPAPMVVAKGADHQARLMRSIAFRHRVPIVQDVALARSLFELQVDAYIPEPLFPPVASALRNVWAPT